MTTPWRFIPCLDAPGAVQMAIDAWLLDQHVAGRLPTILRFYTWTPAAISLGYHQRTWPPHWHHVSWQGQVLDLVKRPTGGRAVLHQGDLTYAIITSEFQGQRMQVYRQLCQFLIEGLRSHQVDLAFGTAGRGYIHNPNCFGTATAADLVLPDGSKLIGSAQLRRRQAVLQHGSIRLNPDPGLFHQIFGTELDFNPKVLPSDLKRPDVLISTLVDAAQRCYGIELGEQPLTADEYEAATVEAQ